jgi:arylsulfatase A-like enzyme
VSELSRRQLLAATAGGSTAAGQPPQRRRAPNVVLFLIDDLGWRDVGFNGGELPTPNIDRIAREGAVASQFCCYPLCTPSRTGLLTGRSSMRQGLMYSVIRPWSSYGVPLRERLLSNIFADAGYRTAIIGKWHLGHAHLAQLPNQRGFHHFYGHVNAEIDYFEHTKFTGLDWQRNGKGVREPGYATELLGTEAVAWLRAQPRNKPYFLYIPFNAVHSPMQAPREALDRFQGVPDARRRVLAAMLHVLDVQVGRVLESIEQRGETDHTLVIFLSDNGGALVTGSRNLPYRAAKLTPYEGGLRVPAAFRWPGRIAAGKSTAEWLTILDILPTLWEAAQLSPGDTLPLDGVSFLPTLTDAAAIARPPFFVACKRNETQDYQFALRTATWKLVSTVNPRQETVEELFDLAADPYEKVNLVAQSPPILASLREQMETWKKLHPKADIDSSMSPHPGWVPPADYSDLASRHPPAPPA